MPTWLQQSFQTPEIGSPIQLVWRIGMAFVLGCIVAVIYRATHRSEPISPTFPRTLVLLSILIGMVTQVIGDNIARAFSLVGALSIVRFRTVVRDTQDTAFVIFAVIVGMAAGADHLWVAFVGLGVVTLAIFVLRPRQRLAGWVEEDCNLSVRVGIGTKPETLLESAFPKYVENFEVLAIETAQKGSSLELTYRIRLRANARPLDLVEELNKIDGVQSVEFERME